jgi:hypothetical protein
MPTFILSTIRSGASLLAGILNCHPNIECGSFDFEYCIKNLQIPSPASEQIQLINISPECYFQYNLRILDALHILKNSGQFIWLTRHPLISTASAMNCQKINSEFALPYWYDVNTCFWYLYHSLPRNSIINIKYEDILLRHSVIKRVFDFVGVEYNDQYIRYGDFDQPLIGCPIFDSGRINRERIDHYPKKIVGDWPKYNNTKLIKELKYNRDIDNA